MELAKVEIEAVHKTKVYKTVADQLQRKIRDGLMKAGDWLPPRT
jgi:DNA-binding FadR family transcriptional regulator